MDKYSLSNGAKLIECKRRSDGGLVVLARVDFGYHPFVTWRACPSDKDPSVLDCDSGRYFADLADAVESLVERGA